MADGSPWLAMDRDSVRTSDRDGRLHVAVSHISKANVCPYFGREIPDNRALGLDPDKVYYLLRDPKEMAKPETVASANNLPILSEHVPVTAKTYDGHQPELVVGSTGTDAAWADPYMDNSMVFWAKAAVEGIDTEVKKELSSAYYYRADMTPGVFKGVRHDGVMRDIFFNHLCQVTDGRAGDDVVVMDSALVQQPQGSWTTAATDSKEKTMTKTVLTRKAALVQGAMMGFLAPKLALDAQIDYAAILKGVGPKNYKARKPGIVAAIKKATDGKLAQDADIDDFHKLLDSLDDTAVAEATADDEEKPLLEAGEPLDGDEPAGGMDDDPCAKVLALLDDKVPADVLGQIKSILQPPAAAQDEENEDNAERPTENDGGANPGTGAADEEEEEMKVTPAAMDAAIKAAVGKVRKDQSALRDAEAFVRPWVGEVVAMDSAEEVLRSAAKALGVDSADTIHVSALKTVISMQPKPGARPTRQPTVAMDAASAKSYAERFPGADQIRSL